MLEMQRKGLRGDLWGFEGFIWDLGNEEEEIKDGLEYIGVFSEFSEYGHKQFLAALFQILFFWRVTVFKFFFPYKDSSNNVTCELLNL